MHGLFRVRGFTQDDAHIFCLPHQIAGEIRGVCDLVEVSEGGWQGPHGLIICLGVSYDLEPRVMPASQLRLPPRHC
jgi:hypothetical protein